MDHSHFEPDPDFEWLLTARDDIQHDLLRLFEFVGEYRIELLSGDDTNRTSFALLVGATFSLWRAAFLSDIARGWPEILERAELLIRDLLLTNALQFATERSVRDWMFGYYLKNAIYRLIEVQSRLVAPTSTVLEQFAEVQQHALVGEVFDSTESWRITQSALRELTMLLKQRVSPPSTTSDADPLLNGGQE